MKWCTKLLLIALCMFLLTGCGQNAADPHERAAVDIVDDRGKTITLQRPAMRIISLDHVHTEKLFSLGLNAEIVGVSHEETSSVAKANPAYGYSEDPQRLIAAQPQLVLATLANAQKYPNYIETIEQAGIPVACLDPEKEEFTKKIRMLTGVK